MQCILTQRGHKGDNKDTDNYARCSHIIDLHGVLTENASQERRHKGQGKVTIDHSWNTGQYLKSRLD